ncbi:four helix bundle protein [Lacipirellula parvula]|uniref:Four helix bundle protein n=1 Tax=Lacipirellula parvula TaxID=2650471 RepID=A0A5K7X760_9BACT|nr:four helix bundle protein [Lacipirellula parvula]BBO32388.1 four helix bundle protein [Lacipirellula parvula]
MRNQELSNRTKQFALRVMRLFSALPHSDLGRVLGKQLLRSGTSVGANYREACRARSDAELISKLGIVEQELDESIYWMELLVDGEIVTAARLGELMTEADELMKIVVTSIKTIKSR